MTSSAGGSTEKRKSSSKSSSSSAAAAIAARSGESPSLSTPSLSTRTSLTQHRQQHLATDLATAAHDELEAEDVEDNVPLFWQPGKRGFYSPRIPVKGGSHHPSAKDSTLTETSAESSA